MVVYRRWAGEVLFTGPNLYGAREILQGTSFRNPCKKRVHGPVCFANRAGDSNIVVTSLSSLDQYTSRNPRVDSTSALNPCQCQDTRKSLSTRCLQTILFGIFIAPVADEDLTLFTELFRPLSWLDTQDSQRLFGCEVDGKAMLAT